MFGIKKPKIGVSFSGGAAFGLAHIGVLQSFEESGLQVDFIAGASAGAIIGTLHAFEVPLSTIREEASQISWKMLSRVTPSKLGLISNNPLGALMDRLIGEKNIEDASIPLAITATDIRTGEQVVFRKGPVRDVVRASAAIPGVFTPVLIGERLLVDGGLSNNLPFTPLIDMGADVTIGVDAIAHSARYTNPKNYADIIANTYNIFIHRMNETSRKKFDILIDPNLGKYMIMDLSKAGKIIAEGYRVAQEARSPIEVAIRAKTPASWWSNYFLK